METGPIDDGEIAAMALVYRTLAPHPRQARNRMMEWVYARLEADDEKKAQLAKPQPAR